jgi:hypothetical protein
MDFISADILLPWFSENYVFRKRFPQNAAGLDAEGQTGLMSFTETTASRLLGFASFFTFAGFLSFLVSLAGALTGFVSASRVFNHFLNGKSSAAES